MKKLKKNVALTGIVVGGSLIASNVAKANLLTYNDLGSANELRTQLLDNTVSSDGKSVELKCGEGKCGEGKCGGDKKAEEKKKAKGKKKTHKKGDKSAEHKCGEGKCGGADAKKEKAEVKK